jgi:hypothetical protein
MQMFAVSHVIHSRRKTGWRSGAHGEGGASGADECSSDACVIVARFYGRTATSPRVLAARHVELQHPLGTEGANVEVDRSRAVALRKIRRHRVIAGRLEWDLGHLRSCFVAARSRAIGCTWSISRPR